VDLPLGSVGTNNGAPEDEAQRIHARALGARLQSIRVALGVSRVTVSRVAGLADDTIRRLECGATRPRGSTLHAALTALALLGADIEVDPVLYELAVLAGPALAAEPQPERLAAILERRRGKAAEWRAGHRMEGGARK
jgi:transcriptional regulator with XRE-family HTH domain